MGTQKAVPTWHDRVNPERGQVIAVADEPSRAQKVLLAKTSRVNHNRLTNGD